MNNSVYWAHMAKFLSLCKVCLVDNTSSPMPATNIEKSDLKFEIFALIFWQAEGRFEKGVTE